MMKDFSIERAIPRRTVRPLDLLDLLACLTAIAQSVASLPIFRETQPGVLNSHYSQA